MSTELNRVPIELPPEVSLLLDCARTQTDIETALRIRETAGRPLDWDRLIEVSLTHGLMPLLYENLKAHAADVVPPNYLQRLKDLFQKNAARTTLLAGELFRILDLFAAEGIEAMPYKGPAIAVMIYGRLTNRQFVDLDILVRRRDVWRGQQILIAQGYEPHFNITERQLPAFLKLGYVQMFTRDRGQSVVELHWGIASRFFSFPLDTDRFWDRLRYTDLLGRKILAPSFEDLLLILCVHGAKDLWERLEWICGIAELLRTSNDIDWETVNRNAKELGVERIVLLGLCLARELFNANLPDKVLHDIEAQPMIATLAREVRGSVLRIDPQTPSLRQRILFHLRTRERVRDRIRYCVRLLFTTTPIDWQTVSLPASLSFVYALLRPFRLAKKYAIDHSKSLPSS
jgi:Uncharacterised nucleotidyltransferase